MELIKISLSTLIKLLKKFFKKNFLYFIINNI